MSDIDTKMIHDAQVIDLMSVQPLTPGELLRLEQYLTERARGLMHTPEWQAKMKELQDRYNFFTRR